jgi:hypothetical protein
MKEILFVTRVVGCCGALIAAQAWRAYRHPVRTALYFSIALFIYLR